ncbi:MAG TPA: hypothetical protein VJM09_06835 [Sphingobium sp.]|nr:hypothetical protein [Sphingobium sp.]
MPRTPEWSGTASYEHVFRLPNEDRIAANVSATAATSRYLSADFYGPGTRDGGYVLVNADLTYTAPGDRFKVTGFVRNLTNHAVYQGSAIYVVNGFAALFGGPETKGYSLRTIGAPRTYGVRATFNF